MEHRGWWEQQLRRSFISSIPSIRDQFVAPADDSSELKMGTIPARNLTTASGWRFILIDLSDVTGASIE